MNDRTANLLWLLRLACLAIAVILVSVAPAIAIAQHPAAIVTQEPETDEQRDQLPYRVYAQWAIETFDKNRDGSLTKDEMQEMRSPLVEDRFDLDENGKLSFDEIVAAVSKPSSNKVDLPKKSARSKSDDSRTKFTRYATGLINQYDLNQDGELSLDEQKKMRRQLPPGYDSNGDKIITLAELVGGLSGSGPTEEKKDDRPTIVVQSDFDLDPSKLAERFFEASLKKNDKNGDRKLDAEEIATASWSTPKWQASDTNSDGELDEDELRVRYRLMFAKLLADNAKTDVAIAARTTQPSRKPVLAEPSKEANSLSNAPLPQRNALANKTANRVIKTANEPAKVIDLKLMLMRMPLNSTATQMTEAVAMLKNSEKKLDTAFSELALQLGVKNYDQIILSARDNHEASIQSGGIERQAIGINRTTRGTTTNFQNVDVGLMARLIPKIEAGNVAVEMKIEKSDLVHLETREGETPNDQILNWSYESVVQIENGNPAIVASSSAGQHWILAIEARIR